MPKNVSTESRIWLSIVSGSGVMAIIIGLLVTVIAKIIDPLELNSINPDLATLIYAVSSFVICLVVMYIYLVFKWLIKLAYGYVIVTTTDESNLTEKKLGIKIYSKRKIDLSNVYVELVRFSDLMIGKEHRLFAKDTKIVSQLPLEIQLFHGGENAVIIDFPDGSISLGKMLQKNDEWFGEQREFVIKVFGKFENEKYEFMELYRGNFIYVFSTAEEGTIFFDGKVYKAAQIRWEKNKNKKLKRISKLSEYLREIKRKMPLKYNAVMNSLKFLIARWIRFSRSIVIRIQKKFS